MNFKVKRIKNPREFPYQKYTSKIGKHKFEANLYEDNGGQQNSFAQDWIHGY